jgi:hypothetical protein
MSDTFRSLCVDLVDVLKLHCRDCEFSWEVIERTEKLLSQSEPEFTAEELALQTEKISVSDILTADGVFLGQDGLEGLANANSFWELQPYGTRLYYGEGGMDYLHRDVLKSAIRLLIRCNPTSSVQGETT